MRRFLNPLPPLGQQRFQKSVTDYAPGVLWLVRNRIAEHRTTFGGRPPDHLILHTNTLRGLFTEYLASLGDTAPELPPVESVVFGVFEGVRIYHCQCGKALAPDMLVTCDGKDEDL